MFCASLSKSPKFVCCCSRRCCHNYQHLQRLLDDDNFYKKKQKRRRRRRRRKRKTIFIHCGNIPCLSLNTFTNVTSMPRFVQSRIQCVPSLNFSYSLYNDYARTRTERPINISTRVYCTCNVCWICHHDYKIRMGIKHCTCRNFERPRVKKYLINLTSFTFPISLSRLGNSFIGFSTPHLRCRCYRHCCHIGPAVDSKNPTRWVWKSHEFGTFDSLPADCHAAAAAARFGRDDSGRADIASHRAGVSDAERVADRTIAADRFVAADYPFDNPTTIGYRIHWPMDPIAVRDPENNSDSRD